MLKAVLTAIPTYTMSCSKIPQSLCKRIQSALTRFWWDSNTTKKKMCWVAWNLLAKPKKQGGLGFREVKDFNEALLGKLSWRLLNNPNCLLSRVLTGKYCSNSPFLEVKPANNSSHGWQSILAGCDLIAPHVVKAIGNGKTISIWRDTWIPKATNRSLIGPATKETSEYTVSDLFKINTMEWNPAKIQEICPSMINDLLCLQPSNRGAKDSYHWIHSASGIYSSISGYYTKISQEDNLTSIPRTVQPMNWIKDLWAQAYSPKLKIFIWKIIQKALPTGENLRTRGMEQNANCSRCNSLETAKHFFFECPFAKNVWEKAPFRQNLQVTNDSSFEELLMQGTKQISLPPTGVVLGPLFPWICWTIWTARNQLLFQNRKFSEEECISKAVKEASNWGRAQLSENASQKLFRSHSSNQKRIPGMVYLMTDAAWKESSSEAGIAWNLQRKT